MFDLAGDLDPPLGAWLWKIYSVTLKNFCFQLCWGFKHQICLAGKPTSAEFIEHSLTGVSDVIITWLERRKCLIRHRLLVFSFFPSRHFFWTDYQMLFAWRFIISCQESVWPRSNSFLGHTKKSFNKNCSWSYYLWHMWHMAWLMHRSQHS